MDFVEEWMKPISKKIGVILLYTLCWLSYYQIIDIIRDPNKENMIKIAWALFAGSLMAYVMGFDTKFKQKNNSSPETE